MNTPHMQQAIHILAAILLLIIIPASYSADQPTIDQMEFKNLNDQVEDLKNEALTLSRDIKMLEEALLFPANTQLAVYISLAKDSGVNLASVRLLLDQKIIANHIYTERELEALHHGGAQRIYQGNITSGQHTVEISYSGKQNNGAFFQETYSDTFNKEAEMKYLELIISNGENKKKPGLTLKELQ